MIHSDTWLHKAKSLHIGQTIRVKHSNESRMNLLIGNSKDRWHCWCFSCKDGGVVMKEHVLLRPTTQADNDSPVLPNDYIQVRQSEYEIAVARYLASKGMDFQYLPNLFISPKSKRILLRDPSGAWHGRDITDKSNYKWMNYDRVKFVGTPKEVTVITEDLFSMYKMQYALAQFREISVCCTLGASVGPTAALMLKDCTKLVYAYDADKAGDDGYKQGFKRMQVYVPEQYRFRPPEGQDPKDMHNWDIRNLIKEVLNV